MLVSKLYPKVQLLPGICVLQDGGFFLMGQVQVLLMDEFGEPLVQAHPPEYR